MKNLLLLFLLLLAVADLRAQQDHDARILAYRGLRFACGDSVTPVLRIQNVGTQSMGACVVETWKNGLILNSFNWQLAVPAVTDEVRQPAMPTVSAVEGDVLEFHIISVNGVPDEDSTGNVSSFTVGAAATTCGLQTVEVEVLTDEQPSETTWLIRNDLGQVLAQGGPYTNPTSTETQWLSLPVNACFGVELSDAGSNGIAGGHLKVRCDGVDVIQVNGSSFTDEAYEGLRSGAVLGIPQTGIGKPLQIVPNPAHDQVVLRWSTQPASGHLLDASGRTVRELELAGVAQQIIVDLQHLVPGIYTVVLRSPQGVVTDRLLVK
ncbi:MAG: T9SS type A sorting domain-containing protein [Flavobacteriales bacterium]|nr:T9SS type A sorting domain-containing protein [Flavobacteriales bacterium]